MRFPHLPNLPLQLRLFLGGEDVDEVEAAVAAIGRDRDVVAPFEVRQVLLELPVRAITVGVESEIPHRLRESSRLHLVGGIAGDNKVASREVGHTTMLRVAKLMEFWSKITGRAPMTTYKNTLFALQHCYVDASRAVEELGMPQTPIETAVRDSIDWFRANGYA